MLAEQLAQESGVQSFSKMQKGQGVELPAGYFPHLFTLGILAFSPPHDIALELHKGIKMEDRQIFDQQIEVAYQRLYGLMEHSQ